MPEGFSSLAEATLAGCKCVLFGKGNRHWPCPIHASCKRPNLGQRKAAQIGPVIGVLVQNQDGKVCSVTDLGRCTWLNQDVTGPGDGKTVRLSVHEYTAGSALEALKFYTECMQRRACGDPEPIEHHYAMQAIDELEALFPKQEPSQ